jgi:hypothetical protein
VNPALLLLLFACGLNLGVAVWGGVTTWRRCRAMDKVTRALRESPALVCATEGHDLELAVETLEGHQPPRFVFTHLLKWSCRRCDYVTNQGWRMAVDAPGVEHIESGWLEPPK